MVKSNEKGVGRDLPLALGIGLVLEVGILELGADVQSQDEFLMCLDWLLTLDESEDLWAINVGAASVDDGIADFTDKYHKSRWSIVVIRIVPNQLDSVHDWNEQVNSVRKLSRVISQLMEEILKGLKILEVLIGLCSGSLNLLLELAERSSVCGLVLLQEFKNLLDSLRTELFTD